MISNIIELMNDTRIFVLFQHPTLEESKNYILIKQIIELRIFMNIKITRNGRKLLSRKKVASKNEQPDTVSDKDIDLALSELGEDPEEDYECEDPNLMVTMPFEFLAKPVDVSCD